MTKLTFKTTMYEHQLKAVEKLIKIKVGALYMEQGTGKTRTTLELISRRLEKGKINHILWLCPCSVKKNLERDIEKHVEYNTFDNLTICGIETLSSSISTNIDLRLLVQNKNVYLIVDESNLIKNPLAYRTKNIIELSNYCKYKLILNGTPISRNEADLFAQWYVLDYRILGYKSYWSFAANHLEIDEKTKRIVRTLNTDYLVQKIAPYTYQIKKNECLTLPPKTYETEYYNLTFEQQTHYDTVANDLLFEVDEMKPETIYRLFTGLQNVISGFRVITTEKTLKTEPFFKNPLDNPRIQLLVNILDDISFDDCKIIIFCKYTLEITNIVEILNKKYSKDIAVPFNGTVSLKKRDENILKFQDNTRFLVANKTTAGYGLNLQFCNYVIYYNNDWDFATRSQSEDRVHRIGQNKNVHIVDICANYTLDKRILNCLQKKERLVDSFKREIDKNKNKSYLNTWINGRNED